jgi:phage gpG-like protein
MITAELKGTQNLKRAMAKRSESTMLGIDKAVIRESLFLVAYIKLNKLSDGVLRVRTGRLRRSITAKFEGEGTGSITARIGTNVKYARIHEFGFNGKVRVPEHNVKEFMRMQSIAFGKLMKQPRRVTVKAHVVKAFSKQMNMPKRAFMIPSLNENTGRITTNIRKALAEGLR